MNSITTHTYTMNRMVRSITRSTVRERTVRRVRLHSNEEFVSRVRQIFLRFRKHNLYLKASKTYLGYKSLDFVGKVLSPKGLSMPQKKINLY